MSGWENRGGDDSSIQFINFGWMVDKSFKEWRQKMGEEGGRVGDNNILNFFVPLYSIKECHFPVYFLIAFLYSFNQRNWLHRFETE